MGILFLFTKKPQHRKKSWSKFEWKHINNGVLTHNARSRINLEFYSGIKSLNGAGACGGSRRVLIRMQNATGMTMAQFWQLNCGKKFKGEEDFSERFSPRSRPRFEFLSKRNYLQNIGQSFNRQDVWIIVLERSSYVLQALPKNRGKSSIEWITMGTMIQLILWIY